MRSFRPTTAVWLLLALAGFCNVGLQVGYGAEASTLPEVKVESGGKARASITYATLCHVKRKVESLNGAGIIVEPVVRARSKGTDVVNISLTIESSVNGEIKVPVDADGVIGDFPITDSLERENPSVVANEPKGTLELALRVRIPVPNSRTFPYSELANGLRQANVVFRREIGLLGFLAAQTRDVELFFPKTAGSKAELVINAKDGPRKFIADQSGKLVLQIDNTLAAENPEVVLSDAPQSIVVDPAK